MISIHPLLAQQQLPLDTISVSWKKMDSATRDILIILGAVALVSLFPLMWALVFRKRRRQHSRHHRHHHHHHSHSQEAAQSPEATSEEESSPDTGEERRRHRHRRRRQHRPRNPTLAETGGLPPIRTGRPPDPYP